MKNTYICSMILASLVLGLFTVFTVPAGALDFSIQIGSPPPRPPARRFHAPPEPVYVRYYDDAVLNLGCSYFGLDYPVVYAYSRDYNLSPDEVVYILYLSHYSHRSPTFVINVYQRYHRRGWSVMSRQLGLRGSYPRWLRDRNAPTLSVLYATSAYYDVPYSRVRAIYTRGYQPAEIVVAINISSRSGQQVNGILVERNKGRQWEDITRDNKVSLEDIKSPRSRGNSVKFGAPLEEKGQDKFSPQGSKGKGQDKESESKGKGKDNEKNKNKGKGND